MKMEILQLVRCNSTGSKLKVDIESQDGDEIISGMLVSDDERHSYPII